MTILFSHSDVINAIVFILTHYLLESIGNIKKIIFNYVFLACLKNLKLIIKLKHLSYQIYLFWMKMKKNMIYSQ